MLGRVGDSVFDGHLARIEAFDVLQPGQQAIVVGDLDRKSRARIQLEDQRSAVAIELERIAAPSKPLGKSSGVTSGAMNETRNAPDRTLLSGFCSRRSS